jgi:hypothetical protein
MSATFSKLEPLSVGSSASGSGPHIEELRAFFKTRDVAYGSAEDLKPFVDRLDSDAGFRDEISSMVRTIIYRERDGLSRLELIELMETAVGGPAVDDAETPEVREAVGRLMVFVESVFRSRRNPGAVSVVVVPEPEQEQQKDPETEAVPVEQEAVAAEAVESAQAEHPKLDMFYRARMAAQDEEAETVAEERTVETVEERTVEADAVEPERLHTDMHWHVPFEDLGDRGTPERGSPVWLWVAGSCALLLAFCAGLFVHQRLIVPLRDPNTPYERLPPETAEDVNGVSPTPAVASGVRPAAAEKMDASSMVMRAPVAKPSGASAPGSDANLLPRYMAPATMGAPAGAMAGRLVYAPPPAYPMMAQMTRTQGKVTVEAVVGKDGRVVRAQAIGGHRLLRGAAVREVLARRYRPYTLNDRPVDVATMVTVDFRLKR